MNGTFPWAGNAREEAVKRRGWGWYASHIGDHGSVYMRRFILLLPFGFTIRLHNIMRSDGDRHLHDHPFDFTSFLLSGGYTETTPCDTCNPDLADCSTPHPNECSVCFGTEKQVTKWPRFSIVRKRAEDLHSLELSRPLWTLVFAGPKRREWGFATELGWISNREYRCAFPEKARWQDVGT